MTDHYREAETYLKHADDAGEQDPGSERAHLTYATVHATLAIADKLGDLLVEWRKDVDSEPIPPPVDSAEVEQAIKDWFDMPDCTACGGTGKTSPSIEDYSTCPQADQHRRRNHP